MIRRPAYSSVFAPDALRQLAAIPPLDELTTAWAWGGSTGKGVKVAVIDSGIESGHPGLIGPPVAGYVRITVDADGSLVYDTAPHADLVGHGTACASIVRNVAPECDLYSVQVLGPRLGGKGIVFAAGLRWAIEHRMHVCNLSLGTTQKDFYGLLHELTDQAYFKNVMLVVAANNLPIPTFPAVYSSVISVACHDLKDPYLFYYNPEPPVEFGAPGIDLRLPWRGGQWFTTSGNSFAAPHITGIVAKVLAKHPELTVFQMKAVLRALAANLSHPKGETADADG